MLIYENYANFHLIMKYYNLQFKFYKYFFSYRGFPHNYKCFSFIILTIANKFSLLTFLLLRIFSSFDLQLDVLLLEEIKVCETIGSENDFFESEFKMRNNIKEHPFPFQRYFVLYSVRKYIFVRMVIGE